MFSCPPFEQSKGNAHLILVCLLPGMPCLRNAELIPSTLVEQAIERRQGGLASFEKVRKQLGRDYVMHAAKLVQRNRSEFYKLLYRHELEPAFFESATRQQVCRRTATNKSAKNQVRALRRPSQCRAWATLAMPDTPLPLSSKTLIRRNKARLARQLHSKPERSTK
jgi:hypothetical protein